MTTLTTLTKQSDGTYSFEHNGMDIQHPCLSDCGRGPVSPEHYGFTVWATGGGCEAWGRNFVLADGTPVEMLITHPDGSYLPDLDGGPVGVGVYDMDGAFVCWTVTHGDEMQISDLASEGWNH